MPVKIAIFLSVLGRCCEGVSCDATSRVLGDTSAHKGVRQIMGMFPHHPLTSSGQGVQQDFARWDFSRADLRGWNFAGAQLQYATFCGANLQGVSLREADTRGAIFDMADLSGADFTGALAQGACFRRAQLQRASFRQALLLSAHVEYACVVEADFTGANLEWVWVEGVDFQHAVVCCALFLNARGLAEETRRLIEAKGGFTGVRPMLLGRELYDVPQAVGTVSVRPRES